jgi:hypothetical protein
VPGGFSGGLRDGLERVGQIPGQQIGDTADGVIGDLFEYAAEVDLRIEPVKLGCSEQRIDRGCADAAGIRSTE